MASTFITPTVVARTALPTLYNSIVLAGLVNQDFNADFNGKVGDTVNIRKPSTFTAVDFDMSSRTTSFQDATETSVALVLDHLSHVPFHVTDEEMTLEIASFSEQLLTPAMETLAQYIDQGLAEAMTDAAEAGASGSLEAGGGTVSIGSGVASDVLIDARTKLGRNNISTVNRRAVLSPEAAGAALKDDLLIRVDQSGATQALREGNIGRIVGFDTYESQTFGFGAGDRGVADGLAFHRDSTVLAIRPLQKPLAVPDNAYAVENYKSLSLRVVYSYDHASKMNQITVDILYGMKAVRPSGIVELDMGQGS